MQNIKEEFKKLHNAMEMINSNEVPHHFNLKKIAEELERIVKVKIKLRMWKEYLITNG